MEKDLEVQKLEKNIRIIGNIVTFLGNGQFNLNGKEIPLHVECINWLEVLFNGYKKSLTEVKKETGEQTSAPKQEGEEESKKESIEKTTDNETSLDSKIEDGTSTNITEDSVQA